MPGKVGVPIAVAGVVVAVVVVVGGIFVFADDGTESGSTPAVGPAPTTRLNLSDSSATAAAPGHEYPPVPVDQVDGDLSRGKARTAGRNVYIPVQDNEDCIQDQVWLRGEHADRVEVEIRRTPPAATGSYFSYDCGFDELHGPRAVIELAEPLGDRRLVVTQVFDPDPV